MTLFVLNVIFSMIDVKWNVRGFWSLDNFDSFVTYRVFISVNIGNVVGRLFLFSYQLIFG